MAKKICAIVSLSIIGVLIIATIIMANINLNYNINCNTPIYVYVNSSDTSLDQQTKIVEYINNSSKQNSLSALFNGTLNKKAEIVPTGTKTLSSTEGIAVEFFYNEPQDLMLNNKKYTDNDGKTYTYERLIFDITEHNGEAEFKVYVIPNAEERNVYTHYYVLYANFAELYSYLSTTF